MERPIREEKEQRWQEMAAKLEKITDALGMPVDGGIKETVIVLNVLGFHTTQSCEGHVHRGEGGPWVDIKPECIEALERQWWQADEAIDVARKEQHPANEELFKTYHALRKELETSVFQVATTLMDELIAFYAGRVVPHDRLLMIQPFLGAFKLQCHGTFLQQIAESNQREAKLREYQEEMCTFTAFLKEHYFVN